MLCRVGMIVLGAVALPAQSLAQTRAEAPPTAFPLPPPLAESAPVLRPVLTPVRPVATRQGTLAVGANVGLGSPYGHVGGVLGYHATPRVQLEFGGGYSARFGGAVGAMARVGVFPSPSSFASLGLGLSANVTSYAYLRNCTFTDFARTCRFPSAAREVSGAATPLWLNVEVANDLRWESGWGVRYALGAAFLTNPSVFPTAEGCPTDVTGASPCGAGVAHRLGDVFYTFYVRLDVYFTLGGGG